MKNKREITEYICKVDQDELGIMEDEFDDLKDLFKVVTIFVLTLTLRSSLQMFDVDQDGILNLMEAQHVLRCLGFRGTCAESVNIRNKNLHQSNLTINWFCMLRLLGWWRRSVWTKLTILSPSMSISPSSRSTEELNPLRTLSWTPSCKKDLS